MDHPTDTHPLITDTPGDTIEEEERSSWKQFIKDLWDTLLWAIVLFVLINTVTARVRVEGYSMEPNLHNGEFLIVNKLAYKLGEPQRGDVIVFHPPGDPAKEYIKRVIGLPGEEVTISDRQVWVDGNLLEEPYIAARPNYMSEWNVPADAVYVLGDNRNQSSDSHEWGPVQMEHIVGKAILVYWPIDRWRIVSHSSAGNH